MFKTSDEMEYDAKLQRQMGPGMYFCQTPQPSVTSAFPEDVWVRPQNTGVSLSRQFSPVDIETELRGIGIPSHRQAVGSESMATSIQGNRTGHYTTETQRMMAPEFNNGIGQTPVHFLKTSNVRIENPALALKGETPNRFDPVLFHNPVDKVFVPFDRNVNTRIVSKDQWRPSKYSINKLKLSSRNTSNLERIMPVYSNEIPGYSTEQQMIERTKVMDSYTSKMIMTEGKPEYTDTIHVQSFNITRPTIQEYNSKIIYTEPTN